MKIIIEEKEVALHYKLLALFTMLTLLILPSLGQLKTHTTNLGPPPPMYHSKHFDVPPM